MKRVVVAVRDRAADSFGSPFYVTAIGSAIRSFADEVNRAASDNPVYQHPDDFDLYELGTFDDATGLFETGTPRQIAVGKEHRLPGEAKLRAVN